MGIKRIFVQNPSEENVLKAIHMYKPVWGVIPPSEVTSILNFSNFKMYDVSSVKLISCGGSTVSQGLMDRVKVRKPHTLSPYRNYLFFATVLTVVFQSFNSLGKILPLSKLTKEQSIILQKKWNKDIVVEPSYGLIELSGRVTIANPKTNILSPGKLAPGVQLKVVEMDTKKSLGPNKVGELYLKSNGLMKGYVGNLEATNEAIDDDGWFHTGDLGYYDDHEYIYIVDRIREMIKYRNMKVQYLKSPLKRLFLSVYYCRFLL